MDGESPAAGTDEPVLRLRPMAAGDEGRVLGLLAASLDWVPDDLHARYFRWKHVDNPAGASPCWVAEVAGRLAGFRAFLRWRFVRDGVPVVAVRAVDTATHPDYRGRGVFRALTLGALDELRAGGVGFVFNTPNAASLPGYRSMGWATGGRLPVRVRVASPTSLARVAGARAAAAKWSEPVTIGEPAGDVLGDERVVSPLLAARPPTPALETERTVAHLSWRYGFAPLHYRALPVAGSFERGVVIVRVRRRGRARELTVADVLTADPGDAAAIGDTVGRALRSAGADVAVGVGVVVPGGPRLVLPGQGPVLVHRDLATGAPPPATLAGWALTTGDVELL